MVRGRLSGVLMVTLLIAIAPLGAAAMGPGSVTPATDTTSGGDVDPGEHARSSLSGGDTLQSQVSADSGPVDIDPAELPGSGTSDDPYVITNASELQAMEGDLDATYRLGADIDASATTGWNGGDGFDPIGNAFKKFSGTFDGAGYTITGLHIDRSTTDEVGLFGSVGVSGHISNVTLIDVVISGSNKVGGLVGYNKGTVRNGTVSGAVTGSDGVGGLVGNNVGTVKNASATDAVDGSGRVGGLVGNNDGGTVRNVTASGAVNGSSRVGGLVGENAGTIRNAFATGAVTGSSDVGGLVGDNSGTVTESYWDVFATGQPTSSGGTDLTTAQMTGDAARTNMTGFAFGTVWETQPDDYPILSALPDVSQPADSGPVDIDSTDLPGNGTADDPYIITNASELQAMEDNLSAAYRLGANIDASDTVGWNGGDGFDPIGESFSNVSQQFTGQFDGAGYTITGLTIDRSTIDYVGLFGGVADSGQISNVTLTSVVINGSRWVGGLVGRNNGGEVSNASASGAVTGSDDVGGLVGRNENEGTVRDASASGAVTGSSNVGGLVGQNEFGTVRNASASGAVNGSSNVGGLVGENEGTVRNASAIGAVTGSEDVGGLVGVNDGGTVRNAFATGPVTGSDSRVGGLIGRNDGSVSESYWNVKTTGQSTSSGGTGLTTAQMTGDAARTYLTGFAFGTIWETRSGGYPVLKTQPTDPIEPPQASFTVSSGTPEAGTTVTFDGSGATDPDGTIMLYEWDLTGDGSVDKTGETVSYTYTATGTYNATLTVTDADGASDNDTVSVTVTSSNDPPTANAGPNQTVDEGDSVTLDGTKSSDPDNDSLSYSWSQIGGESVSLNDSNGPVVSFTAPDVDTDTTLTFELTVSDGNGRSDTDRVSVTLSVPQTLIVNKSDPDAYQSIQAAVDDAQDGDTVEVRPGVYREQVTVGENITLIAPAGATLNGSETDPTATTGVLTTKGISISEKSTIAPVINGFKIIHYTRGIDANQANGSWKIKNSGIAHISCFGIYAPGSSGDWIIKNTTIWNTSCAGIDVTKSSSDWKIHDTTIRGTSDGNGIVAKKTTGAWLIKNTTLRNTGVSGIKTSSSKGDWVITGSLISGASESGVSTRGSDGGWSINNTIIKNSGVEGVRASDTTGRWNISNSIIKQNSDSGISAEGSSRAWVIRNVTVHGNSDDGIFTGDSSGNWNVINTIISQNNGAGIRTRGTGKWSVENSVIQQNSGPGVDADYTSGNWTVRGTKITKNGGYGVTTDSSYSAWEILNSTVWKNMKNDPENQIDINAFNIRQTDGKWEIHYTTLGVLSARTVKGNATHNWWGQAGGPKNQILGTVDVKYTNWLTSPPNSYLKNYSLTESRTEVGRTIVVTATLENTATTSQTTTVTLYTNGTAKQNKTATIPAESTKTIEFNLTFDTTGSRDIRVGPFRARTLEVVKELPEINLESTVATPGSTIDITLDTTASSVKQYEANITFDPDVVQVNTVGGTADFGSALAQVDNTNGWVAFTQSRSDGVSQPDLATITFDVVTDNATKTQLGLVESETSVCCNADGDPFVVTYDPANVTTRLVTINSYDVAKTNVGVNQSTTVTASVENTQDTQTDKTLTLYTDGTAAETKTVTIPANSVKTVNFSTSFNTPGTHNVSIGELDPTTVNVEYLLSIENATIAPDEQTSLTLETNAKNVSEYNARIEFDPSVVEVRSVSGTDDFGSPFTDIDNENGYVEIQQSQSGGVDQPELAVLNFEVKTEKEKTTEITIDHSSSSINEGSLKYFPENGELSVHYPPNYTVTVDSGNETAYQTIQAAINNVSDGAIVKVHPDVYDEQLRINKNISLIAPEGAKLNGSEKYFPCDTCDDIGIYILSDSSVKISGFKIESYDWGVIADHTEGDWKIINSTIRKSSSEAIDSTASSGDWLIKNTTISNNQYGLRETGSESNWTILSSTFENNSIEISDSGVWGIYDSRLYNSHIFPRGQTKSWEIYNSSIIKSVISASDNVVQGDATRNWWGQPEGPVDGPGPQCENNVNCSNHLIAPPGTPVTLSLALFDELTGGA